MSNYSFSDAAIQDLNEICEYITQNSPSAASRLFDAIRQKCKLVAGVPNMGRSYERLSPALRGFVVEDYIVFYYDRQDGIDITRIVSGYRNL